jgi:hypothetical protein
MTEQIEMQFRPSLIICVGRVGALIREHLSPYYGEVERNLTEQPRSAYHLLSNLDRPLRNSVGLLQVDTECVGADPDVAIPFAVAELFPLNDADIPRERGPLKEMIRKALISVQLDRRILNIRTSGYAVPNTRTQVFIVGEPTGPELDDDPDKTDKLVPDPSSKSNKLYMSKILKLVRDCVRDYHFETPICYVLNSYQDPRDYSSQLMKKLSDPADNWQLREVANFSYLYEQMISFPAPVFVTENESRYAAAEGLLALTATGITSLPAFENAMQLPVTLEDYSEHVGNLSTSTVMFPRAMTQRYCSARLSSLLVQKWLHDLNVANIPGQRRLEERDLARNLADDIESWIEDQKPRPMAEESFWPNFGILFQKNHPESEQVRYRQIEAYRQMENQTENLFAVFSPFAITDAYKQRRNKAETWTSIANDQCDRAVSLYTQWEQRAIPAWDMLSARINAEIRQQVDMRWSANKDGFEIARIYVDQLDDQLMNVLDHVRKWRRDHDKNYGTKREHFLAQSKGNWTIDEAQPNIVGAGLPAGGQASPTMNNIDIRPKATKTSLTGGNGGGGIIGSTTPTQSGGSQHLPQMEAEIARDLRARAVWKENHIPPVATLCSTGFMSWLALALSASIPHLPPSIDLTVKGILALAFAGGSFSVFLRRLRESNVARKDMLDYNRLYYIHNCEHREDLQRIDLLKILRSRVTAIRQRLDDMSTFLSNARKKADSEAEIVQDQLFNGPAGVRDIFVANGERLQEHGAHTLDSVASKIELARQNQPLEEWHRNFDKMRDELVQKLKQGNETLLEMTEEKVQETLYSFTAEIIDGYLVGSLVDLGAALDKPEVWREILERVSRPLYYAEVGRLDLKWMFVCGNPQDLTRSARYIPSEAIQVRTKSSEWLMIASFFSGGSPKILDANTLFPYR